MNKLAPGRGRGPGLALGLCLAACTSARGGEGPDRHLGGEALLPPPAAAAAEIEEHLGARLDGSLPFTDMDGRRVRLGDALAGDKPVLLVLAYYRCPMLCGLVLRGTALGLSDVAWQLGRDYRVLTVSFDPKDTVESAREKRKSTLASLSAPPASSAEWPFLLGDEASIRVLADTLGFRFAYDASTDSYAHPAAIFALTPDGRVSRYLYGVDFPARDLRFALTEAGEGRTGSVIDRVLLTCYRFDPASRRYAPFLAGFLRLGGALIVAVLATLFGALWLGERRRARTARREERP